MVEIGRYYKDDLEKQSDCREKVWEASGFLLDLVNDVLDMNKLESGQIQLSEDSFDLQDILNEVTSILTVQAKKEKCLFLSDTDTDHALAFNRQSVTFAADSFKYYGKCH